MQTLFFFFQAEDGIRDYKVTGVQTCALPILIETVPQRLPLYERHDVVQETVRFAGIVQGQDVGMSEAGCDLDLTQEALGPERCGDFAAEVPFGVGYAVLQVLWPVERITGANVL